MEVREQLELAAKAIGKDLVEYSKRLKDDWIEFWNPYVNNTDAFGLMVELGLTVKVTPYGAGVYRGEIFRLVALKDADNLEEATRRAIVRVAIEIGKGMK